MTPFRRLTAAVAFAAIEAVSRRGGVLWGPLCHLHGRLLVRCRGCGRYPGTAYGWVGPGEWDVVCRGCDRPAPG